MSRKKYSFTSPSSVGQHTATVQAGISYSRENAWHHLRVIVNLLQDNFHRAHLSAQLSVSSAWLHCSRPAVCHSINCSYKTISERWTWGIWDHGTRTGSFHWMVTSLLSFTGEAGSICRPAELNTVLNLTHSHLAQNTAPWSDLSPPRGNAGARNELS